MNEDPNARMIRELTEELAQLRSKLGGGGVGIPSEDIYPPGTPLDQQMVSITQADGSIKIPEVLRKYMGGREFIK